MARGSCADTRPARKSAAPSSKNSSPGGPRRLAPAGTTGVCALDATRFPPTTARPKCFPSSTRGMARRCWRLSGAQPLPSPHKNPQKRKHIPSQVLCPLQCLGEEDAAEVQLLLQLRKHLMGVKRAIEVRMAELRVQSFSAMSMCVLDAGPPGTSFDGSTQNCNGRIGCECRS